MHATENENRQQARGHSRSRVAWIGSILAAFLSVTVAVTGATLANAASPVYPATHNPAGTLGVAISGRQVHFYGTASDVDARGPVTLVYYLNGTPREIARTNGFRFSRTWIRPYGTGTLRVVAINVGTGTANTTLGSRTFRLTNPATRNPHSSAHFAHTARTLHVRGVAYDPDKMFYPLVVRVFSNGHKIAVTRTNRSSHNYAVTARLYSGVNHIAVVAYNIGAGTQNKIIRTTIRGVRAASSGGSYSANQAIAARMLPAYHWGAGEMAPLVALWNRESGWRVNAANPSGAYGIPQALPGSKMASAGANWRTSATTQIRWGLSYIRGVYGSPHAAWAHSQAHGWY